jgi:hypothetical protein
MTRTGGGLRQCHHAEHDGRFCIRYLTVLYYDHFTYKLLTKFERTHHDEPGRLTREDPRRSRSYPTSYAVGQSSLLLGLSLKVESRLAKRRRTESPVRVSYTMSETIRHTIGVAVKDSRGLLHDGSALPPVYHWVLY